MALQMYLTEVFNSETWIASAQQTGRSYGCIYDSADSLNTAKSRREAVNGLVINTPERESYYKNLDKHETSFKVLLGSDCDSL